MDNDRKVDKETWSSPHSVTPIPHRGRANGVRPLLLPENDKKERVKTPLLGPFLLRQTSEVDGKISRVGVTFGNRLGVRVGVTDTQGVGGECPSISRRACLVLYVGVCISEVVVRVRVCVRVCGSESVCRRIQ